LRFPEFSGEWEKCQLGEIVTFLDERRKPIKSTDRESKERLYPYYGASGIIDYIDHYIFDGELILLSEDGANIIDRNYRVAFIAKGKYWVNNHAHVLKANDGYDNNFISELLESMDFTPYNTGSTMPKLNQEVCKCIKLYIPSYGEQMKISGLLTLLNNRIETQKKVIEKLQSLIGGIRKKIFNRLETQFGLNYQIGDLLDYEQPSKYIVDSDEYENDQTLNPVLTANKAFILGYTNESFGVYDKDECIILDDFTLDSKYVTFKFKVKSSAIKILTPKYGVNLRYIFEYMQYKDMISTEHKRHYISEVEPMEICYPDDKNTRNKIVSLLASYQDKLLNATYLLNQYNQQKAYLLSTMFI
jgi:type I restriction enzyme S subunit